MIMFNPLCLIIPVYKFEGKRDGEKRKYGAGGKEDGVSQGTGEKTAQCTELKRRSEEGLLDGKISTACSAAASIHDHGENDGGIRSFGDEVQNNNRAK